jgi:plasma-membrane proton-efflux P-type ATPase
MTVEPTKLAATALQTLRSLGSKAGAGMTKGEATARLASQGPNEVPEVADHPLRRLAGKFWGLSAWMIELIALLSLFLHKLPDFVIALSLLVANALLSFFQEQRASTAVSALRSRLQVSARVLRDATWQALPARELVAGDLVRVRAGDFVPADVQVLEGAVHVDQSTLTGESAPVARAVDEVLFAASTVRDGEATAVVVATGTRTTYGRTTELVQSAHPKLHVEQVISRVVKWLFVIVGLAATTTTVTALARGLPVLQVVPIALVLLMSAVPVALPVMFTVSMALGSLELGKRGVLVTRLSAIEDAATMDVLCADKTGTLTMNRLSVTGALPEPGFTEDDVVLAGAWASNAANADPIDAAFLRAATERHLALADTKTISFEPFSAANRHTEAVIEQAGTRHRVFKGAVRTVVEAAHCTPAALTELERRAAEQAQKGVRVLAVARADGDGPLRLCGLALLYDAPRPEAHALIDELRALGVRVLMLTGDALPVAQQIASTLGLGSIARAPRIESEAASAPLDLSLGGLAEVYPEAKFQVVKRLQAEGHVVGMTGDGVNDGPALRQAEVGIAVSGATDVARGAASAVLTTEGLVNIVDLVKHGRATYQRVLTWIVNKVSRSILKAGYVVIAYLVTGHFVISALVMLLVVMFTDLTHVALATDRVTPSPRPETWNIGPLVGVSVVLGVLTLGESLALLAFGWHRFGLSTNSASLQTFTFQTFLFFAVGSLLSVRERRAFFRSRPSLTLTAALSAAAVGGGLVGFFGVSELAALPVGQSATVFAWALLCTLGPNDAVKAFLTGRATRRPATQASARAVGPISPAPESAP